MPVTRFARQRDMRQAHAGMDGEIVDALLALLDQRVAIDLPGQLLGDAADLLQRLIDRHRADGHRRIADDPFADGVDVAAGGEVHHRVAAPADRPHHLLDFLGRARGDDRVADIGVDLGEEVAADDHRLGFGMVDVGRDDGAAARDLRRARIPASSRSGMLAPKLSPSASAERPRFSRTAMYSISLVMMPARAYSSWVTLLPGLARSGFRRRAVELRHRQELAGLQAVVFGAAMPALIFLDVAAARESSRGGARADPCRCRSWPLPSVYGPEVS